MISSLRGVVLAAGADHVIVEVGGVGFHVAVTAEVAHGARLGSEMQLHTTLIVREDALSLYGFTERVELEVFELLLGVTGVGPKSALGVLGHLSVDQIAVAVADDDDAPFRRVSGIGPKTAKLITVQLAGKLQAPTGVVTADKPTVGNDIIVQTTTALIGLGWSEKIAADAVAASFEGASDTEKADVGSLLRRTLATLGPARSGGARG